MSELYHIKKDIAEKWIELHKQTYIGFHTWAREKSELGSARGWIETQDMYQRLRWVLENNSKGKDASGPLAVNHNV